MGGKVVIHAAAGLRAELGRLLNADGKIDGMRPSVTSALTERPPRDLKMHLGWERARCRLQDRADEKLRERSSRVHLLKS